MTVSRAVHLMGGEPPPDSPRLLRPQIQGQIPLHGQHVPYQHSHATPHQQASSMSGGSNKIPTLTLPLNDSRRASFWFWEMTVSTRAIDFRTTLLRTEARQLSQ